MDTLKYALSIFLEFEKEIPTYGGPKHCEAQSQFGIPSVPCVDDVTESLFANRKSAKRKDVFSRRELMTEKMLESLKRDEVVASRLRKSSDDTVTLGGVLTRFFPQAALTFQTPDFDWILMPDFLPLRFTPTFFSDGLDQLLNHGQPHSLSHTGLVRI